MPSILTGKGVAIIGGAGTLGLTAAAFCKARGCYVSSIDVKDSPVGRSIKLSPLQSWKQRSESTAQILRQQHENGLDFVFCAAGGWLDGNTENTNFFDGIDAMWEKNAQTSLMAAYISSKLLNKNGLLVLTGAKAALNPTPNSIGYGMSKMATIHLCTSLAANRTIDWKCITLLPDIIDNPANQEAFGRYVHSDWTPPGNIAEKLVDWLSDPLASPPSGSLISISTVDGITSWKTGRLKKETVSFS